MDRLRILYFIALISISGFAQVGINTKDPKRDLDINGGLRIEPGLVTNVMQIASQTLSKVTATSTTKEKLSAQIDYIKKNYNKVLVSNGRGEVDYIDINDFYAFSDKHLIYKSYVFEIDRDGAVGELPNTNFEIPGFLKGNLHRLKIGSINYVEILVERMGDNYLYILGRMIHDGGVIWIGDERDTKIKKTFQGGGRDPISKVLHPVTNRLNIDQTFGFKAYDLYLLRTNGNTATDPLQSTMFCKIRMAFNVKPVTSGNEKVLVGISIAYLKIK